MGLKNSGNGGFELQWGNSINNWMSATKQINYYIVTCQTWMIDDKIDLHLLLVLFSKIHTCMEESQLKILTIAIDALKNKQSTLFI